MLLRSSPPHARRATMAWNFGPTHNKGAIVHVQFCVYGNELDVSEYINRHYIVYLSSVVAWEIEIKQAKGALPGESFDWPSIVADKQLIPLSVSFEHVMGLRNLPAIHKDPFDRLLIAQAQSENLQLSV